MVKEGNRSDILKLQPSSWPAYVKSGQPFLFSSIHTLIRFIIELNLKNIQTKYQIIVRTKNKRMMKPTILDRVFDGQPLKYVQLSSFVDSTEKAVRSRVLSNVVKCHA